MNKDEKTTIITIMVGCLVLFMIFPKPWLWMVAIGVGLVGMFSSGLTGWIHHGWYRLAEKIGFIMSRLILGVIFIVILLPLALLAKLFRRDLMLLKPDHSTYFIERSQVYERRHLENPW